MAQYSELLDRAVASVIADYLDALRVVVLNGPRQAGKTTLLRQTLAARGGELRNLDDESQFAAARRDPIGFVESTRRPLYIDEVQRGGEALVRAVKAAVDADPAPGQFVLAGSTRFLSEPTLSESLAGRAGVLEVLPFSQGELLGRRDVFIDVAFADPEQLRRIDPPGLSRRAYLDLIAEGAFPGIARMSSVRARGAWYRNYVASIVERDIREMARVNRPSAAERVLRALAASSAQTLVTTSIAARAELPRETVDRYIELLDAVFLIHRLQPWSRNPLTKAVSKPKVYSVDTGLLCYLLGASARSLARPTDSLVGCVVETFVVNELRKQASWAEQEVRLFHYRDHRGRGEIDVIVEAPDGRLVGVEVKAAQSVVERDFRHLADVAAKLGSEFVHGFVVYLGARTLRFGERLSAIPLSALWSA